MRPLRTKSCTLLNEKDHSHDDETSQSDGAFGPEPAPSLSTLITSHLQEYILALNGTMPANGLYDLIMREVERPLLKMVLTLTRGNQKKASQILGINRNTLRRKMLELSLDSTDF